MKRIKYFMSAFLILSIFLFSKATFAAEGNNENAGEFSVLKLPPDIPEVHRDSSFYDLLVKPGETITLKAQITNNSENANEYLMKLNTSFTNGNGEISYTRDPTGEEKDSSLKDPFSKLASFNESSSVIVNGKQKKLVSITIQVPNDAPNGVILGAWYFEKKIMEKPEKEAGMTIANRFAYALAVKMTVNEELKKPNLKLLKVRPSLNNYRKVVDAQIENDQRAVLSNLSFHGEVKKQNSSKVLYQTDLKDRIMAPNSNFYLPIFLKEGQLAAGKYTLFLTATTKDEKWPEKTWTFTKDFTVSTSEAKKLNKEAINDPEVKPNYLIPILISIIVFLLILLLVLFFFRRKNQNKKS